MFSLGLALSLHEKETVGIFLRNSVQTSTLDNYRSGWQIWEQYLSTLSKNSNPGRYFEYVHRDTDKQGRLVLFYLYLYQLGKREEQIVKISSAMRYFIEAEQYDSSFFNGVIAKRGRSAAGRDNEEKKAFRKKQAETQILPLGLPVVLELRNVLWTRTNWESKEGMDMKGTWISIGLGYDGGNRISNVAKGGGPRAPDHCIKAEDILFSVSNPVSGLSSVAEGGERLRKELRLPGSFVQSAALRFWTASKTVMLDHKTTLPLLSDLVEWIVRSGVQANDVLCSRYWDGRYRAITTKDVRSAIKRVCSGLNLPSSRYSTKSLRSGFATHFTLCEGVVHDRNSSGGWSSKSSVPEAHYDFAPSRGALALLNTTNSLSVTEMRRMANANK